MHDWPDDREAGPTFLTRKHRWMTRAGFADRDVVCRRILRRNVDAMGPDFSGLRIAEVLGCGRRSCTATGWI